MSDKIETVAPSRGPVTVACKLPHGLLLRGGIMAEREEPMLGGGYKTVKFWRATGQQVLINGYAVPFGMPAHADLSGGYALTTGVDAEFWDNWLKMNGEHPAVKSGLLFAMPTADKAKDKAIERASVSNGVEPLAQKGDARIPKNVSKATEQRDAA